LAGEVVNGGRRRRHGAGRVLREREYAKKVLSEFC
jgi:hypothetical protein